MKKLLITLLFVITLSLNFTGYVTAGYSTDTSDRYEEQFTLCNGGHGTFCDTATDGSDYLFNGVIVTGKDDMILTPNQTDEVTFELANVLSHVVPQDGYEVSTITMKINAGFHYESDNIDYQTTEDELVKDVQLYQVGETNDFYESTQFILNIEPVGYEDLVNYVAGFSYTGDSTPEFGKIKISSATIIVMYTKLSESYGQVIDVDSDYSKLPNTQEQFLDIISIDEYNQESHSYKMTYAINNTLYSFNVAIPEDMYSHEYSSKYQEQIDFKDITAKQMSIGTSAEGENILYIQPDFSKPNKPAIIANGDTPDIVGFASINLTSMEYNIIHKFQLTGVVSKEKDRYAYLYCYFPTQIEDLLSISLEYEYRINTFFNKGEWQTTTSTMVAGDQYQGEVPSWMYWIPGYGWGFAAGDAIRPGSVYDIDNVIVPLEPKDIPDEVDYRYINELGGDKYDKYSKELYKVTLGQFQDGVFTAFSDENAYDISELVILNILYEYKGKVYEATEEEIDSIISTPEVSDNPTLNDLLDTSDVLGIDGLNSEHLVWGFIAIVNIIILMKSNFRRDKWILLMIILGEFYILHKMGLI